MCLCFKIYMFSLSLFIRNEPTYVLSLSEFDLDLGTIVVFSQRLQIRKVKPLLAQTLIGPASKSKTVDRLALKMNRSMTKSTNLHVRPAKIQIILGIRPV